MAILSNLLVNGESRLLGKLYTNDIDIGGIVNAEGGLHVGKNTAANANIYLNNKLAMRGIDAYLRINDTNAFTSGIYFGNSAVWTKGTLYIGDSSTKSIINNSSATIAVPATFSYTANANGNVGLKVNGTATITTGNITTANTNKINNADMITTSAMDVKGKLHAVEYDLENIMDLGGSFVVAPTLIVPSSGSGTKTLTVTKSNDTTVVLTVKDPSITSTGIAGFAWANNYKVKVSGLINNTVLGTCDGYINSTNVSSNTISLTVTMDSATVTAIATTVSNYKLNIMLYNTDTSSATAVTKPLGIYLQHYQLTNNPIINVWNGQTTTPKVRIGYLGGITYNNENLGTNAQNSWGLYSDNVFLEGQIVAKGGKIGGYSIGTANLTKGTTQNASGSFWLTPEGQSSVMSNLSSSAQTWAMTVGQNFGVTTAGAMYAQSGYIATWKIEYNDLVTGTWGSDNSAMLCTGTSSSKSIGGSSSINGWVFTAGSKFGVTKTGALYCNDIHATGGSISGSLVSTGISASNITTGTLSADRIGANSISIGKLNDDVQQTISGSGINLYQVNTAVNGYLSSDGKSISSMSSTYRCQISDWISVEGFSTITAQCWNPEIASDQQQWLSYCFYTSNDMSTAISGRTAKYGTAGETYLSYDGVTVPSNAKYIRVSYRRWTKGYIKVEKGSLATDYTPAPEDVDNQIISNSTEYIAGTQTVSTRFWTGTSKNLTELKDGTQIAYWLPYASKSEKASDKGITADELNPTETITTSYSHDWLKLTFADGTTSAWVPCYYGNTTRLTTHYGVNNIIKLTYRTNVGSIAAGWWADGQYYTDTVDRKRINNAVKVGENLTQYCIAGQVGTSGYKKIASGVVIDLSYPIAYLSAGNISGQSYAVASGGTTTVFYTAMPSVNLQYTKSSWTGTQYAMCYIKGSLSGNSFTVHSDIFTTTVPTTADGFYYIPIGILYSTYQVNFDCKNQLYCYKDGAFGPTSTRESSLAAKTATDYITYIDSNGIWVTPSGKKPTNTSTGAGATGTKIDGTNGVQIYDNGIKLAEYSSGIKLYQPNGTEVVNISTNGAIFKGSINATSGFIGQNTENGFNISASAIYNPSDKSTLNSNIDGVYFGRDGISLGDTFRVTKTGELTSTNGTIGGWTIGEKYIESEIIDEDNYKRNIILSNDELFYGLSFKGENENYATDMSVNDFLLTGWTITKTSKTDIEELHGYYLVNEIELENKRPSGDTYQISISSRGITTTYKTPDNTRIVPISTWTTSSGTTINLDESVSIRLGEILNPPMRITSTNADFNIPLSAPNIGEPYDNTLQKQITTADIDTFVDGASIKIPSGVYFIVGTWTFETGSSSGGRNMEVRLTDSNNNIIGNARNRIYAAGNNYAILQAVFAGELSAGTYKVRGSCSMKTNTTGATSIYAIQSA